ncbi:TetR/AcrR family transcriptional regulator [Paraeggerthella hongkongensis]|uniref:TetR/AcrR family transcriptional regulator n=1 Tax=Paraeggerthella hongkongensis TaxID=230658 RepID=UPI001FCEAC16|nr:TetR/AcrR family transcriptional regulator [Paraeggerthella hongkongensis]
MKVDSWEPKGLFDDEDVQMKLRIMHAVDRSLDQIKVTDLCERAGISRQMFYRHFDSKYSLHWWWPTHVHKFYLVEIGRTIDWETGYFHHLTLLSLESDFFKVATQYTLNCSSERSIMPHYRKCALLETLQDYRHIEISDELMFCLDRWVKTETEILTEWYRMGTMPLPQEAAEKLALAAPRMLYDALLMD